MNIFLNLLKSLDISADQVDNVTITGNDPILPSPFLIGEAGASAIALIGYLASELWVLKKNKRQQIKVSVKDAAIAQRSHEYIRLVDGKNQDLWNPISGFYQTKDNRWIQLHCNFPHHKKGVISFLNCADNRPDVEDAIKNWQASKLEEELSQRGLCAAMVRTSDEWNLLPQAKIINQLPLMEIIKIADSAPESLPNGNRPLSGIKVLDLTRVIAGPVCGKTLAEHGATVMNITSPNLPFIAPLVMDTGFGKFSAFINLENSSGKMQLTKLIHQADIFSQSYRPEGLAEKGFSPEQLAEIRPGIIYVSFSAYSHAGPWANRHGYDSLVQSATGIVAEQSSEKNPKHLPAQSLDYITGYLAAIGAMEALKKRALFGGSYLIRVSLAQTAHWLKQLGKVSTDFSQCEIPTKDSLTNLLKQQQTSFGCLEYLAPILQMSETPPHFDKPPVPLGTHAAEWP